MLQYRDLSSKVLISLILESLEKQMSNKYKDEWKGDVLNEAKDM